MKLSLLLLFLVPFASVKADIHQGKIHSIIKGHGAESHLVRLDNGKVLFVDAKDLKLVRTLESDLGQFEMITDEQNSLQAARSVEKGFLQFDTEEVDPPQTFIPTVLADASEVEKMFNRLNRNYQRVSQCFNRAHVWASEEYKSHNIMSEKLFVFFTASYIRRAKFNWWFHVAPLVSYQDGEKVSKSVLDYRYADRPLSPKEWTDMFVYSGKPCVETTKFSDYDVNPQTEDCYQITTNMYFWQPQDIAVRDTTNVEKETFANGSVENARWEAF